MKKFILLGIGASLVFSVFAVFAQHESPELALAKVCRPRTIKVPTTTSAVDTPTLDEECPA